MKLQLVNKQQLTKLIKIGFDVIDTDSFFPEVALAVKWLRDKKHTDIVVVPYNQTARMAKEYAAKYQSHIHTRIQTMGFYETYEQAESAALDYALDYLINERKEQISPKDMGDNKEA